MNPLRQLLEQGQSYWLDNLTREMIRSYFHRHSGISRAGSRHSGGKGRGRLRAALISDTVLPVFSGDRAIRLSWAVGSRRTGPRVPVVRCR